MAKNIIVPVDFSDCSKNATKYAAALAQKINGKLVLLHAFHNELVASEVPVDAAYSGQTMEQKSHQALHDLSCAIEKDLGIQCDYLTRKGLLPEVIEEVVKIKKAELVVIGTKGASGWTEFLIGSQAAEVIGRVNHPVLVVPEQAAFNNGIGKICFATDFHDNDIAVLKELEGLGKLLNAHIEVLHIAHGDHVSASEEQNMKAFMEKAETKAPYTDLTYRLLNGKNIEQELEHYLAQHKIGLMVVSTRHRNWFEKIFSRSISKKLVMHTHTPVMVFHYKEHPVIFS